MTTLTKDDLETVIIDCLKAFHRYGDAAQPRTMPTHSRVMSLPELIAYTGISKSTIYKLTSAGDLPHSKKSKRLFFERDLIDKWLMSQPANTRSDTEKAVSQFLATTGTRRRVA